MSCEAMSDHMKLAIKTISICTLLFLSLAATAEMKLYYVHNDHLNTPQLLTDENQNVVWAVESQTPFGEVVVNEDPDGDGESVVFNVRFPGQYFDEETGLSYNYFRTYDASLGRYVQSDPIGLAGGINTYGYVGNNPNSYVDPDGLLRMYGGWCGPDWTGGFAFSYGELDAGQRLAVLPPVDELDACCRDHDIAYAQCRDTHPCDQSARAQCMQSLDRALASCAANTSSSGFVWMGDARQRVEDYMRDSNPDGGANPDSCECEE